MVTNFIGKFNSWDEKINNYKKKELMNYQDINEWISNGMSIGSHSHSHSDLTKISEESLVKELEFSKKILEDKFGNINNIFCYPYGKVNKKVYSNVKKIYDKALTTNRSRYDISIHDFYLIPRIDMGKNFSSFKIFLKLKTIYEDIKYTKNEYICNCSRTNYFDHNYTYWENRQITTDELEIINFLEYSLI